MWFTPPELSAMSSPFQRVVSSIGVLTPEPLSVIVIVPETALAVTASAFLAAAKALGGEVALTVRLTITPTSASVAAAATERPMSRRSDAGCACSGAGLGTGVAVI